MVAHVKKTQEAEGQNKPGSAEYDFDDHDAAENQRRAAGNSGLASAATASSDATAAASSDATAAVTAAGKKQKEKLT